MINYIKNLRYDEKRGFIFDMERGDSFVMKYLPLKKCYGLKHRKSEHRILLKYVDFDNMTINQIKRYMTDILIQNENL